MRKKQIKLSLILVSLLVRIPDAIIKKDLDFIFPSCLGKKIWFLTLFVWGPIFQYYSSLGYWLRFQMVDLLKNFTERYLLFSHLPCEWAKPGALILQRHQIHL
ncbi:hypothetical protein ACJX0J_005316 [Zea mays]